MMIELLNSFGGELEKNLDKVEAKVCGEHFFTLTLINNKAVYIKENRQCNKSSKTK